MGTVNVTTPSDREICVTRSFNAPVELVFEFHTKPELLKQWLLGPPGWQMPICEVDLRPGGRYRYVWRNDAGREFGVRGEFREIDVPHRIVHAETMDGSAGEALCTLDFTRNGDVTTLRTLMDFGSKAVRDEALESGMTEGMSASFDRLDGALSNV